MSLSPWRVYFCQVKFQSKFICFLLVCLSYYALEFFGFARKSNCVFLLEQITAETLFFGAPGIIY